MSQSSDTLLTIHLSGPFIARTANGKEVQVRGAKTSALIALLACAPDLVRSRAWLISMLWSRADQHQGRASLRQALFTLKKTLGEDFDRLIEVTPERVGLKPEAVAIRSGREHGEFLEGMDIGEEGFEDWLRSARQATGPVPISVGRSVGADAPLRPRIAVLPFLGIGADPDDYPIGDAVAQELIRALSRSQLIEMISHLSSRRLDQRVLDIDLVRERLDVDFVVTGSWRKTAGQILVELDFNDARSGTLIWSEHCNAPEQAFFAGNNDFVHDMASHVVSSMIANSVELGAVQPMPNVATHALLMSAIGLMHHIADGNFSRASDHLVEVVKRTPHHSIPKAWLAQWHVLNVYQGWSADPAADLAKAQEHVAAALDANPQCGFATAMDGNIKTVLLGDLEGAENAFAAALAVNANSPMTCQLKSVMHSFRGEGAIAVQLTERVRRLSPCDPRGHFFDALGAAAYLAAERYDEAVELAESALSRTPKHLSAHRSKVVGLELGGKHGAARDAAKAMLRIDPDLTIAQYLRTHSAAKFATGQTWARALADAGIPMR